MLVTDDDSVTFGGPYTSPPYLGNGGPYSYNPYITQPASAPRVPLPIDEDDYLQPKSANPKAYLDLENSRGRNIKK